jgi:hypothetical protein
MKNHELLGFDANIFLKEDIYLIREWGIVSNSTNIDYSYVVEEILKNDSMNLLDLNDVTFQTLFDLQFNFFFIAKGYELSIEPLFSKVRVHNKNQVYFQLNQGLLSQFDKVLDFKSANYNWSCKENLLSQFLSFNMLVIEKQSIEITLNDIRKLLFKEDKYKSDGDLYNKVVKTIVNSLSFDVRVYPKQRNKKLYSILFQYH